MGERLLLTVPIKAHIILHPPLPPAADAWLAWPNAGQIAANHSEHPTDFEIVL